MIELSFLAKGLISALGVAIMTGPLGALVTWRRMGPMGDTLAHAGLLGIALSMIFHVNLTLGLFSVVMLCCLLLTFFESQGKIPNETLLAILAHGFLACGLVLISLFSQVRTDILSFLYGDILSVSMLHLCIIYVIACVSTLFLYCYWPKLVLLTLNADLAQVEHVPVRALRFCFYILFATVIAAAIHLAGVLLVMGLLLIPMATARMFAKSPTAMMIFGAVFGCIAVLLGFGISFWVDVPTGPCVVVSALMLFFASTLLKKQV